MELTQTIVQELQAQELNQEQSPENQEQSQLNQIQLEEVFVLINTEIFGLGVKMILQFQINDV